jgi:predicted DNA-binding protein
MVTYTSTLPQSTLDRLNKLASEINIPKNKLIRRALDSYLVELDKALMRKSFAEYQSDQELLKIAEEGMAEYAAQLNIEDEAR